MHGPSGRDGREMRGHARDLRPLMQYVRDRRRGLRNRGVIVLAEQGRDGGGDLALGDGSGVRALTQGGGVGTDNRDPDVLRALLLDAVLLPPGQSAAPPVIAGDDDRGGAAVLG